MKLEYRAVLIPLLLILLMSGSVVQANSRGNPAYINEPVTISNGGKVIELELVETYRTENPEGINPYSRIPSGHEILMAKFRMKVTQGENDSINRFYHYFQSVNSKGFPVENNVFVTPNEPLEREFYGPQEIYGWTSIVVEKDDTNSLLVYRRGVSGEIWFSPTMRRHTILAGLAWGDPIDALGEVRFISDDEGWMRYEKVNETLTEIGSIELAGVRYIFEDDSLVGINVLIDSGDAPFMSMVFTALYGPWYMTDFGLTWANEKDNIVVQIRNDEIFGTFISFLDLEAALEKFPNEDE